MGHDPIDVARLIFNLYSAHRPLPLINMFDVTRQAGLRLRAAVPATILPLEDAR